MTRAGREPAEDVKRRLRAVCQEVGLKVDTARMFKSIDLPSRHIYVAASLPDREESDIDLITHVGLDGTLAETVDIRCHASVSDSAARDPVMQGRSRVPWNRLIEELQETLRERAEVIAAVNAGESDPFHFEQTVWKRLF